MRTSLHQLGPIFWENIVYIIKDPSSNKVIVLDPPIFDEIDQWISKNDWNLVGILNTHYHPDHVGGIVALKAKYNCKVWGPEKDRGRTEGIDYFLKEGDLINFFGFEAYVKELLGHTHTLIAFWFKDDKVLFCSDILFSLGCGKFFEGTAEQMQASFDWICTLPDQTLLCNSHENTLQNSKFALSVEPNNPELRQRVMEAEKQILSGQHTVPTTLLTEKKCNPFLRPHSKEIRKNISAPTNASNSQVIGILRQLKDNYINIP